MGIFRVIRLVSYTAIVETLVNCLLIVIYIGSIIEAMTGVGWYEIELYETFSMVVYL